MVRDYSEYESPTDDEAKKILESPEVKKQEPVLHIVDRLPTQEVRHLEKDGQTHEFITVQEAVTTLWNERNKK